MFKCTRARNRQQIHALCWCWLSPVEKIEASQSSQKDSNYLAWGSFREEISPPLVFTEQELGNEVRRFIRALRNAFAPLVLGDPNSSLRAEPNSSLLIDWPFWMTMKRKIRTERAISWSQKPGYGFHLPRLGSISPCPSKAEALNPPKVVTLEYSSSCCSDPPNHKIISLLNQKYSFATVMNRNVEITISGWEPLKQKDRKSLCVGFGDLSLIINDREVTD